MCTTVVDVVERRRPRRCRGGNVVHNILNINHFSCSDRSSVCVAVYSRRNVDRVSNLFEEFQTVIMLKSLLGK